MNNKLTIIIALAAVGIAFTSCKKDKEDPTITVETPAEHSTHSWGSMVHLDATFADDQGLKSYDVVLGDQSGAHDHLFDFHVTGDISGTSYDFHEHFTVPDNAEMMRWVHFTVTDMEDKTATKTWMLHFEQ